MEQTGIPPSWNQEMDDKQNEYKKNIALLMMMPVRQEDKAKARVEGHVTIQ